MVVDGKVYEILQDDVIHCKGTEVFSLTNTGDENMSRFVILAPNPSPIYSYRSLIVLKISDGLSQTCFSLLQPIHACNLDLLSWG